MPQRHWRVLERKIVYDSKRVKVIEDKVSNEHGTGFFYKMAQLRDSVAILAIDSEENIVLVKQYRHAAEMVLIDLPGGKVEEIDVLEAGKRELLEETGYTATRWKLLTRYPVHASRVKCWKNIFLAKNLTAGKNNPEADEELEVIVLPMLEIVEMINQGKIIEPTIQIALWHYLSKQGSL